MIELNGLTKKFSNGKGIFDVTFSIPKGEVFGFLGPNGAGKSTTIRHLMGFMKPSKGSASINGMDAWKDAAKIQEKIGYLPGEISFLDGMDGMEFLKLVGGMRGMKQTDYRDELIHRLQFDVKTPIRKMSKGMKQKVGIVAAFMHEPEVIILDEPTSGLDPLMQRIFIEIVMEQKEKGTTFLMSSHSFSEIERTCDRAAIIKDGKIVVVENIHDLQQKQRRLFDVTFASEEEAKLVKETKLDVISVTENRAEIAVQGDYNQFIQALGDYQIRNIDIHEQNLEEVFLNYYDREANPS
ncbi:ATP-binding cassette domain-containing protein [Bacillus hwajinpoensis]|uniref:ATP-binding cassette domain-containing protein n=1 Tax=Guptibacillus hwajinpoensis TaxID=208199 RepID=A0A845EVC1_9BACL|nr:ABC transporter ATP-binding protein [Pseudalkalibacillus hwajinpoensis]MYL61798.1 ATP-binding cassette domain-containing protein [Pseudalkalibacillus hwajinpoensis]